MAWRVVGGSVVDVVGVGSIVVREDVDVDVLVMSGLGAMKEEVPMTVVDPSGVTRTTTGVGAEVVVVVASSASDVGVVVVVVVMSAGSAGCVVLVVVGIVTPMNGLAVWGFGVVVSLSVGVERTLVLDADEVSSAVVVMLSLDCEVEDDISGIEEELVLASGRGTMTPIVKLVDVVVSEVRVDEVSGALSGAALDGRSATVEECSSLLDEVSVPWCDGDDFDISAAALDECDTLTAEDDVSCVM